MPVSAINIVEIRIEGYEDTRAFEDFVDLLVHCFRSMGLQVSRSINSYSDQDLNLIIGANVIDRQNVEVRKLPPPNSVIYNLEQVDLENPWITVTYTDLLRRFPVWDYNQRNIDRLLAAGVRNIQLVPIGYHPEMKRIPPVSDQPIDVLFYGNLSPRREEILRRIKRTGLVVKLLVGVYGEERDFWITRSKVVVNVHFYDFGGVTELVRLSHLLANRKAVVCEKGPSTSMDESLSEAVVACKYDQIPSACESLVRHQQKRRELEERGFAIFRARDQLSYLRQAISIYH